ncbi:MAG: hypothetical protein ACLSHJ_07085 [Oscillospiraceae bacterium]
MRTCRASFEDVKRCFAAFCKRVRRFDPSIRRYVYAVEAGHSNKRWHIHFVASEDDLPFAVVQFLWGYGFVNPGYKEYPVLSRDGGYRRLARYFCKPDEMIPLGKTSVGRGARDATADSPAHGARADASARDAARDL